MNRICAKHGLVKHYKRNNSDGYRCSKCSSDAVSARRKKLKEMAVEYLGGKCEFCAYDKCISALEFHHKDPSKKDFGISQSGATRSFEKIKKEIDQCILLCANCHREEHARINKN